MANSFYQLPFVLNNGVEGLSIVVSEEIFDRVVDNVENVISIVDKVRTTSEECDRIRKLGVIPLLGRGSKTEPVFTLLEVPSSIKVISIVRRGFCQTEAGQQVIDDMFG